MSRSRPPAVRRGVWPGRAGTTALLAAAAALALVAALACSEGNAQRSATATDGPGPESASATPPATVSANKEGILASAATPQSEGPQAGEADANDEGLEPNGRPAANPEKPSTPQPTFSDVTADAGVHFLHHERTSEVLPLGGGAVVFDFDGNDYQDIYVVDSDGPNALYRNNGDGTFSDVAATAAVADPSGRGNGGCAADYDNDGAQDLYVTNYGPSRLFRNGRDGTFADVTAGAGMDETGFDFRSMGCAWGDYDADGFVDLIVLRHLNEGDRTILQTKDFVGAVGGTALWHNNGDGTFTNVTELLGDVSSPIVGRLGSFGNIWGAGFQPGWLDYDNDGDLDLFVVNDFGADIQPNVLWRNDGPSGDGSWVFADVSEGSGADTRMYGMGLAVGDYNLDGSLDLFVTNIKDNVLLSNNGDGASFTNTTSESGADIGMIGLKLRIAWATLFFDYDNDGDEDLYVVSGFIKGGPPPANPKEQPNVLLQNNADGTFTDVSGSSGADDDGVGRGGVYLDADNDGCLDLFITNLGQPAKLLRNSCSENGWLVVRTVGTASNRDGIGARITVVAAGSSQIREISGGSSSMGQNMMPAHFGLGKAKQANYVLVRWPSGTVQALTGVAANQMLTVVEPR